MQIRKAHTDDILNLQALAKRVILNNYTPFLGQGNVTDYIDSGQSDAEIEEGIARCYVMSQDRSIVGFAIVNNDLLHLIMVDVIYQHQGYGAKLLAFIEREMFNLHPVIRLQTFENNIKTVNFYKTNGWCINSVEYVEGMDMNMIHMEKNRKS